MAAGRLDLTPFSRRRWLRLLESYYIYILVMMSKLDYLYKSLDELSKKIPTPLIISENNIRDIRTYLRNTFPFQ